MLIDSRYLPGVAGEIQKAWSIARRLPGKMETAIGDKQFLANSCDKRSS